MSGRKSVGARNHMSVILRIDSREGDIPLDPPAGGPIPPLPGAGDDLIPPRSLS
jgi:hypothetical protein